MSERREDVGTFEALLSRLMLASVTISALSLAGGLVIWFAQREATIGGWLLRLGLMMLMATPILRVALAVAASIRAKDWSFVATTIGVVLLLAITLERALSLAAVR
jgi:hypothetical protein